MYLQTISSEDIGKDKAMEFDNEAEDVASKRNGVGTGSVRGRVLDMRSYSPAKLQAQAAASKNMFQFAFQNYMEHAFPHDDLRPLSCRGSESYGNIGLTLLDALDSLVIFNDTSSFRAAVEWISENKTTFDVDVRIHVFEVTIRALGGLLSGHILATRDQTLVPGYDGGLLRAAVALADRLVPAFDTPTGLPTSWINLSKGHVRGDIRVTCTACAGTMLLEFATLSRMTGNVTYEMLAKGAIEALWAKRSHRNLLGNTINVDTGEWVRKDSGIGAGIDSFYEYLLKAWLAFGDYRYLELFSKAYAAAQAQMPLSKSINGVSFPVDVHMTSGRVLQPYMSSLAAFWPGLQALAGQVNDSYNLLTDWAAAWQRFGTTPEMMHVGLQHVHNTMRGYPLRPEIAESTFFLYSLTKNPRLFAISSSILSKVQNRTLSRCGYASIADVETGRLEDTMESFFLSETTKYLYLTFMNASSIVDWYIFSTEGHLLPIFPIEGSDMSITDAKEGNLSTIDDRDDFNDSLIRNLLQDSFFPNEDRAELESLLHDASHCSELCDIWELPSHHHRPFNASEPTPIESAFVDDSASNMRSILPQVPLGSSSEALTLRWRRCVACRAATLAVSVARKRADLIWKATADVVMQTGEQDIIPHAAPPQWSLHNWRHVPPLRVLMCTLTPKPGNPSELTCANIRDLDLSELSSQSIQVLVLRIMQSLPSNALLLHVRKDVDESETIASLMAEVQILNGSDVGSKELSHDNGVPAMQANFGPLLLSNCESGNLESEKRALNSWKDDVMLWSSVYLKEDVNGKRDTEEQVQQQMARLSREVDDDVVGDFHDSIDSEYSESYNESLDLAASNRTVPFESQYDGDVGVCTSNEAEDRMQCSVPGEPLEDNDSFYSYGEYETGLYHAHNRPVCDVVGKPVATTPFDACVGRTRTLKNEISLAGSVAVIQRNNCAFQEKVLAAERAGAVAVIMVNSRSGELMSMHGNPSSEVPSIPSVMIRPEDLNAVISARQVRLWIPPRHRQVALASQYLNQPLTDVDDASQEVLSSLKDENAIDDTGEDIDAINYDKFIDKGHIRASGQQTPEDEERGTDDTDSSNGENNDEDTDKVEINKLHVEMIMPISFQLTFMNLLFKSSATFKNIHQSVISYLTEDGVVKDRYPPPL